MVFVTVLFVWWKSMVCGIHDCLLWWSLSAWNAWWPAQLAVAQRQVICKMKERVGAVGPSIWIGRCLKGLMLSNHWSQDKGPGHCLISMVAQCVVIFLNFHESYESWYNITLWGLPGDLVDKHCFLGVEIWFQTLRVF